MLREVLIAGGLTLCAFGEASAQSTSTNSAAPPNSTASLTAVEACENQMRRLAARTKTLAATYNAAQVHERCVASTSTNGASK
jgi:hypothetical protein